MVVTHLETKSTKNGIITFVSLGNTTVLYSRLYLRIFTFHVTFLLDNNAILRITTVSSLNQLLYLVVSSVNI